MAHTKAGGSTKLGRDSAGQRLGVKLFGGQVATVGAIITRQRGSKMVAGAGTRQGRDQTIFAARSGVVTFKTQRRQRFTGQKTIKTVITIE